MKTNPQLAASKNIFAFCPSVSLAGRCNFKTSASARLLIAAALAILASVLAPLSATAATISWGPATLISGDTDVATNGVLSYAYTGGNVGATVNSQVFTAGNSGTAWGANVTLSGFGNTGNGFTGGANAPWSTLTSSYQSLLQGAAYGTTSAGTLTLNNLTVGRSYSVQIWVNDSRAGISGRSETTGGTGNAVSLTYNSLNAIGGVGKYTVGYFVADATTQTFTLTPNSTGSLQLNAISVRDNGISTKVWSGSSSTSWGTAANWSPANVPLFPTDSVLFNSSSTANLATLLDVSYTLATLTLSNAPAPVSIGPDGQTLTIRGGINLLGTSQKLTNSDALVLGASQIWAVTNSGSVLEVDGGVSGGSAALTITGAGNVILGSGATYTGNTTVSNGNLIVTSAGSIFSANTIVTAGGKLNNAGSVASATITVATNSTFAMSGAGSFSGAVAFSFAGGATFDVSAESPSFNFGSSTFTNTSTGVVLNGTNDYSSATFGMLYDGVNAPFTQTNGDLTLSPATVININNNGPVLLAGNHTIITAATTGNIGSVIAPGGLPTVNLTGNGAVGPVSLGINGSGGLDLVVGTGDVWTGAANNLWSTAGNWTGGAGGGPTANPTEPAVFNNLSIANLNNSVNADTVVNGLTVVNPPSAVTIAGPNNLAIGGSGINLQSATVDLTITAPLSYSGNGNINVATNRNLNVNGGINGGGGPIIVGGGTVNLNSAASYSGATIVSSVSTLKLGVANALSASSDVTVNGLMDLQGNSQAMGGLNGSGIVNNSGGSAVILTNGANGGNSTFNGVIQNTGGALALDAFAGNLTLNSSNNTYSGGTTFESGATLSFPSATAKYGTGPVTFKPGAKSYTSACTFTNALFLDSCYLRVGGANNNIQTWSGPVTVANGFQMSGDSGTYSVTLSGPMNIGIGGISITNGGGNGPNEGFNVSTTGDLLSGPISGSGGITYYCNGASSRLTVNGANTYTGGTIVNGTGNGKLNVQGANNSFGPGPIALNAGAIIEAAPGSATVTNALTLAGGTLQSESQFNNYNTLTWSGPITLTADSALVQFATGALNINMSSGVVVSGPLNMGGFTLTCSSPVDAFNGSTISGSISGAGNIFYNSFANNTLTISGSNTFSGTFRSGVTAGTGKLSIANVYAAQNATLDMNAADAGSVSFNNLNCVIGALTGSRNLNMGAGTVSIGNSSTPSTYSGSLSGYGLIKIGTSTLTLSSNAYTGNTTVSGGTLSIAQTSLAFASTVTIASGAVLDLNYIGTNVVTALVLNGLSQPNGVYKNTTPGGYISGTGAIQVGITPNIWTGALSSEWSTNILSSPKNWTSNGFAADFIPNNNVLFDDTLKSNSVVILTNNVLPIGVTFNNNNTNYTIGGSGSIAGACALIKNGAGSVTLNNTNTYTGVTFIYSNTLTLGNSGRLGNGAYAGNIYLAKGATLEYAGTNAQTLSGPITGLGGLLKDGPTKIDLTLSSTVNTYSGQTVITNGRVSVASQGNLGGGTTIVQTNAGQLLISAATTLSNSMILSSIGYPEADAYGNNFDGAVRCDAASTLSGQITLSGNARIGIFGGTGQAFTLSGQITGGYGIDFYGMNGGNGQSRAFVLSNTNNNFTGNANIFCNDFNAARTTATNILRLGASEVIPNGAGRGNVVFKGADANHLTILEMNGFNETINGVTNVSATGAVIRNTSTGASSLTIGDANTNSTFSGVITDGGAGKTLAITKIGSGTLTLSGANTYNGGTTVNGGTLAGTGSIIGLVTINANGTLAPGTSGVGTLTLSGNLTLASGSTNTFAVNGSTPANTSVALGGTVTYGGVLNIVTNGTFTAGQTFTLFSGAGATTSGNFASIVGSPGAGKTFSFTNGVLSVVGTGPSGSNRLTNSITGGGTTLSLSWGNGWTLQQQTNSLSNGLGTNWQIYVSGGAGITSTNISIDQTKPTVFYRLTYP